MQEHLFDPPALDPLPVTPERYVPALLVKPGELAALEHASPAAWAGMTPLLHIVGPTREAKRAWKIKTVAARVTKVREAVGVRPIFLDIKRLPAGRVLLGEDGQTMGALEAVLDAARAQHLRAIPVARTSDVPAQRRTASEAAHADGYGMALRVGVAGAAAPPGKTLAQHVLGCAAEARLPPEKIDLLIDLGYMDPSTTWSLRRIDRLLRECLALPWRSVVLLGASMPKSLAASGVSEGASRLLPRREWELWQAVRELALDRMPAFGDYAIQHPDPPPTSTGGNGLWANVRYSTADGHRVLRGHNVHDEEHGYGQYYDLSEQLAESEDFAGGSFSWGDERIERCAAQRELFKGQDHWRAFGTSHHIELVRRQLDATWRQ